MKDVVEISKLYHEVLYRISDGGVIGHFLPVLDNGMRVERAFLTNGTAGVNRRPYAWIGIESEHGQLLYYKHCASEDFVDSKKFPLSVEFDTAFSTSRSAREQVAKEKSLLASYIAVRGFAFQPDLSNMQRDSLREFLEIWEDTICVGLKPYYRSLSPEFFTWIERNL